MSVSADYWTRMYCTGTPLLNHGVDFMPGFKYPCSTCRKNFVVDTKHNGPAGSAHWRKAHREPKK